MVKKASAASKLIKKTSKFNFKHPRFIASILFVIIFASIGTYLFMVSRAAGTATLTLTPASQSLTLGSNLTVTITENSTDSVNAVQADLTYDSTRLQFSSIDTTTSDFDLIAQNTGGNGKVNIAVGSTTSKTGSRIVAKVTFVTKATGAAAITFDSSCLIIKNDGVNPPSNVLGTSTGGSYTITDNQAPSVPTNLHLTSSTSSSITFGWTASSDNVGVTGYNVFRNGSKVGTSVSNSYTDTGLTIGVNYTYTVSAYDAATNTSAQSSSVTLAIADTASPSVPTNLHITSSTSSSITFGWTASTDNIGVTGYRIYRAGTQVGTSTTNSYTDSGLRPNTSYSYTVSAYDAAANTSSQSSAGSFTTDWKAGDANGDGCVNATELSLISINFLKTGMTRAQGDIETANGNGTINVFDLSVLAANYNTGVCN